jgi:hypothetical protein
MRSIPGQVDRVALEQVFSEYFGFPCEFPIQKFVHIVYHAGLVK